MTAVAERVLADAGIDAIALKPREMDLSRAVDLDVETVTIDFEGRAHVPDSETVALLARHFDVRITVPVRADGFDPLGEDDHYRRLPDGVGEVLVAGHPAYLEPSERRRAVAPRLEAARERTTDADPWVGTEGIERIALAVGGTQFDLLSSTTEREIRALRAAGYDDDIAIYAPTVLSDHEDAVLDAVGAYAARRKPVADALPADTPTDSSATGAARERLLDGCEDYALVGDVSTVAERIHALKAAGADHVVSYPARGLDALVESRRT